MTTCTNQHHSKWKKIGEEYIKKMVTEDMKYTKATDENDIFKYPRAMYEIDEQRCYEPSAYIIIHTLGMSSVSRGQ